MRPLTRIFRRTPSLRTRVAFATAIGAAVALKGKPLVAIEGDGGAMQNIQELDTLRRTGAKLRRCQGLGPCSRSAARCSGVP